MFELSTSLDELSEMLNSILAFGGALQAIFDALFHR